MVSLIEAPVTNPAALLALEAAVMTGDLAKLPAEQRMALYDQTCRSLNLNPLTRPFEYIVLNNRMTLYCRKDATDQLRRIHNVTLQIVSCELEDELYTVHVLATMPNGRSDESTGVVAVAGLRGEALANARMKAETKGKRRATLSICGLGFLDQTEVETVQGARYVNPDTGEITESRRPQIQPRVVDDDEPAREKRFGRRYFAIAGNTPYGEDVPARRAFMLQISSKLDPTRITDSLKVFIQTFTEDECEQLLNELQESVNQWRRDNAG